MKSFENIEKVWRVEASAYGNQKIYFVLVGNKTDLENNR